MWTAEMVLVCALALLPRGGDTLPPIVLLDTRPPEVSRHGEAFVRSGLPSGKHQATAARLDERLRLNECDSPLEAFSQASSGNGSAPSSRR